MYLFAYFIYSNIKIYNDHLETGSQKLLVICVSKEALSDLDMDSIPASATNALCDPQVIRFLCLSSLSVEWKYFPPVTFFLPNWFSSHLFIICKYNT